MPQPLPDITKPRLPGDTDGRLNDDDQEEDDPDVTPLPPIIKVDFDCEKLKECLKEDEEDEECTVKKEDVELQTQACELQEDGTYQTVGETRSISIVEGMGEAISLINQQISFLFEKACNTTADDRPILSATFSETDFVQVTDREVIQAVVSIVDEPRTNKTIPGDRTQQWVYFAGWFVWLKGEIPIAPETPIRRRSQVFIAPPGVTGFFAYSDNAATIEGSYLYKGEE